jgi:protein-disulfide isomerase
MTEPVQPDAPEPVPGAPSPTPAPSQPIPGPASDPTEPIPTAAASVVEGPVESTVEPEAVPVAPVGRAGGPSGRAGGSPPSGLPRLLGYLGAAMVGGVLVLAGLMALGSVSLPAASPSPSPSAAYMEGMALGDPAAPVTIQVWADYQCPYCALQARGVEPSVERTLVVPGQARMVFRDFAFLGQGNDPDESVAAAVAARCAGAQGAYWYYHDLLFASQQGENQGAFARERLLGLAGFAGLDEATFTTCLDDPAVAKAVTDETAIGRGYGVSSTPTMRITGPGGVELLTGIKPLSEVAAAVQRMTKPAASASPTGSGGPVGSGTPAASPAGSASPAASASSPTPSATPASPTPAASAAPSVAPAASSSP